MDLGLVWKVSGEGACGATCGAGWVRAGGVAACAGMGRTAGRARPDV